LGIELIIFYFAAIVAVGAAVMMILQRNPVASVLYLIISLVAQAILYIQLNALFLGALLIIVYAGAILVLFLFVIMLLNLRGEPFQQKQGRLGLSTKVALSTIFFLEIIAIFDQMFLVQPRGEKIAEAPADFGSVNMVASRLFREYTYPFELTSVLLLVAIVGAVMLARRDKSGKREDG